MSRGLVQVPDGADRLPPKDVDSVMEPEVNRQGLRENRFSLKLGLLGSEKYMIFQKLPWRSCRRGLSDYMI